MLGRFVPKHEPLDPKLLRLLQSELHDISRLVVLTGAGISTESGIPDYRSKDVGLYERSNHRPVTHQEFMKSDKIRKRYWARNFLAWPNFSRAESNATHKTLASWERSDRFSWLITQNVDGLHHKAGSSQMTELHGSGHRVRCMSCGTITPREEFQSRLAGLNPLWGTECSPGEIAPDGDVHIEPGSEDGFQLPNCQSCNGTILKTDVVFFGDNVPRDTVDFLYEKIDECDGLLVLGSSLSVMSGYRFAYHVHLQNKPLFLVNIGPTRADHIATVKLNVKASEVITRL